VGYWAAARRTPAAGRCVQSSTPSIRSASPAGRALTRRPLVHRDPGEDRQHPGRGRRQWFWVTWKQATSYWETECGFLEFCGCSPALSGGCRIGSG
jgi:hypothetical protein